MNASKLHLRCLLSAAAALGLLMSAASAATYDLEKDFSLAGNPNGVWSYGYFEDDSTVFQLLTFPFTQGPMIESWTLTREDQPGVYHNSGPGDFPQDYGAQGGNVFPPDSLWFVAAYDMQTADYGVIRFTAPASGGYHLESLVHTYLNGPISGDTDYHVRVNDVEVFGQFLAPSSGPGYTNSFRLRAGDTVDFVVGRGRDNEIYASGLSIKARITTVVTAAESVAELIALVRSLDLPRGLSHQLVRKLEEAGKAYARGKSAGGDKHLEQFQRKVQQQYGTSNPAIARQLIALSQAIIDAP